MSEFTELLCLNLSVKKFYFIEWLRVVRRFYPNWRFFLTDTLLRSSYLFISPFKVSRDYLLQKGEREIYTFGETPLTTLENIVNEAGISKSDLLYDLGCGTGRTSFWLSFFAGCKVSAVEYVPAFVKRAEWVKKICSIQGVDFHLQDMLKVDFSQATCVYFYGSCFDDHFLVKLTEQLKMLQRGATVITVSYPLEDYCEEGLFEVTKQFPATFAWGEADVFVQKRLAFKPNLSPTCRGKLGLNSY